MVACEIQMMVLTHTLCFWGTPHDLIIHVYMYNMYFRHNPSLSTDLAQVRKHFESARKRFLSPLCKKNLQYMNT